MNVPALSRPAYLNIYFADSRGATAQSSSAISALVEEYDDFLWPPFLRLPHAAQTRHWHYHALEAGSTGPTLADVNDSDSTVPRVKAVVPGQ